MKNIFVQKSMPANLFLNTYQNCDKGSHYLTSFDIRLHLMSNMTSDTSCNIFLKCYIKSRMNNATQHDFESRG